MNIEEILDLLSKNPSLSAYVSNDGVFVRDVGGERRVERLSLTPPPTRFPRGSLSVEEIFRELECNGGACDIAYTWHDMRVANAIRRVNGDMVVTIRVYPQSPPDCDESGAAGVLSALRSAKHGMAVVAGVEEDAKTSMIMSVLNELVREKFVLTLEDPITYRLSQGGGIAAQREIGVYGDVPSFEDGVKQAVSMRPDVLYTSRISSSECVRLLVRMAVEGARVICPVFALDDADAIRRILLRGERGLTKDIASGWRRAFLDTLDILIMSNPSAEPPFSVLLGESLEEIKKNWRTGDPLNKNITI